MNTIQDLKWVRLMLLIWAVLLVIVIGGYFGFKQLQKGTTLTNLVQDGLTQNSTFHVEVSAAPTILDKVKDKDIDAKNLDNSSLLYVFNETYENLEFSKKVKDETLANHFTDGKRKLVLFTSHPTTVANYSGVIELNSDWSAKLDNKVFSPRELKFQNTRLKGEYVSGIWFGLFSSEEAERLQKSTFPHAIKVKVKENKYLLVTEGIGEGTYGKTANVSLVDADAIPDDPNNQGAISAIIPGLTDADNKTWTIDERVGEIIYQSDGTVKINSHFTTPNATVKGVLNVRVVSQDKIEATVDHYGEVKCNDPVNFTLHNQDCVALPRDQTPAWKDDKIKELEKQVKEKDKEVKEKEKDTQVLNEMKGNGHFHLKCIKSDSSNYANGRSRDTKTSNFVFDNADSDCWNLDRYNGRYARWGSKNEMSQEFTFWENKNTNTYLWDLQKCKNRGWGWVCIFKGNNPLKLKELYISAGNGEPATSHCNFTKSRYKRRCDGSFASSRWGGEAWLYGSQLIFERVLDKNLTGLWEESLTGWTRNSPNIWSYKYFFATIGKLVNLITQFTHDLEQDINKTMPTYPTETDFKIIGTRFAEKKTINWFKFDICINNIGCYGVDDNKWKIMLSPKEIKDIPYHLGSNYNIGRNETVNEHTKRYGALYLNETDYHYAVDTFDPYKWKEMMLFGENY